jgi:hypothetical protein
MNDDEAKVAALSDWRTRGTEAFHAARDSEWASSPEGRRYIEVISNNPTRRAVPLRFRHILIVAYGRSGSTLLQGILNSINGVLIRGENGNVFACVYSMLQTIRHHRAQYPELNYPNHPWFGIHALTDDVFFDALRPAARSIILADRVDDPSITTLGFKEIRYESSGEELGDYLDFLVELLPECAVIFNVRDKSDTSESEWWALEDRSSVIHRLGVLEKRFAAYASARSNCFMIQHDEVVERGSRLRELFAFLGAEYDASAIDAVLAVAHSLRSD